MKALLIGWLAARGISLANDATDQTVVEGVQKAALENSNIVTALTNDKTTLSTEVSTLKAQATQHSTRNTELTTALENEKTGRKADRKATAGVIVDFVIKRGVFPVAEREAQITALENSADFNKAATELLAKEPARATTTNGLGASGKQGATALENQAAEALQQYKDKFNECLPLCNNDAVKADAMMKAKYPTLFDIFRAKKS